MDDRRLAIIAVAKIADISLDHVKTKNYPH